MAVQLKFESDEDDSPLSGINTTPLVDVMLVLLIIFLITIPVVIHTVPVNLPHETNQALRTRPDTIVIAVDGNGAIYWNDTRLADRAALLRKLMERASDTPQPEVHIRADKNVRYESVGRLVVDCQRAGIAKVSFVIQPDRSGGG
jgi:biopolymer transport protein ExbD